MAYLGSPPASQFFAPGTDTFSGTGVTTAFTLSRNVATVNDIQVVVNNVVQQPSNYTVLNNILTFSPAPSAGTDNIYVRYLSTNLQTIAPQQGSVYPSSLSTQNAVYWDTSGNVGVGTTTPAQKLDVAGVIKSTGFFLGNTGTSGFAALGTTGNAAEGGNFVGRSTTSTYNTGGIELYTGGSERMRIDSSGNVGISTSSPITKLTISGSSSIVGETGTLAITGNTNAKRLTFGVDSTSTMYGWIQSVENGIISRDLVLQSLGGNLLVGTTSQIQAGRFCLQADLNAVNGIVINDTSTAASVGYMYFLRGGTARGSITFNGSVVAYNTTSDYRLKENIAPMTGALSTISALKPVTYTWKETGQNSQGFIAHELQSVIPDCVTGEKDAVDAEGNPSYQGVDTSFLVATLTAAIQEQQAMIEELKTKVAALEAR